MNVWLDGVLAQSKDSCTPVWCLPFMRRAIHFSQYSWAGWNQRLSVSSTLPLVLIHLSHSLSARKLHHSLSFIGITLDIAQESLQHSWIYSLSRLFCPKFSGSSVLQILNLSTLELLSVTSSIFPSYNAAAIPPTNAMRRGISIEL